jgi:hypothetical protein
VKSAVPALPQKAAQRPMATRAAERRTTAQPIRQVVQSPAQATRNSSLPISSGGAALRVRPKLVVGAANDAAEVSADRFAAQTVRALSSNTTGTGAMTRREPGTAIPLGATLRRRELARAGGVGVPDAIAPAIRNATERGHPMPASLRDRFEKATGRDLSAVRLRHDPAAAQTAVALGARAYTRGSTIVFAHGEYAPETGIGASLLAHELAHVAQIGAAPPLETSVAQPRAPPAAEMIHRAPDETGSTGFLGSVVDKALSLLPDVFANTLRRIRRAGGLLPWLGGLVCDGARSVLTTIGDSSPALAEAIAAVSSIGPRVSAILGALAGGDCEPLFAALEQLKTTIQDAAGTVWTKLTEFLQPVGDFLGDINTRFLAPAIDTAKGLAGSAWERIQQLAGDLWDLTQPVRDFGAWAWRELKRWIGLGEETDAGGNESGGILGWLKTKANEVWAALKDAAEPVLRPMREVAKSVSDFLPLNAIKNIRTKATAWLEHTAAGMNALHAPETAGSEAGQMTLRSMLLPALNGAIAGLREGVTGAANWTAETVGSLGSNVAAFMGSMTEHPIFGALAGGLAWLRAAALSATNFATDTVRGAFRLVDDALGAFGGFIQRMLDGFTQVANTILDLPGRFSGLILGPIWNAIPACIRNPVMDFITKQILGRIPVFSSLVQTPDFWEKCQATAMRIIRAIFVDGDIARGIFTFFCAMLDLIGLPSQLVTSIIAKAATALSDILKDPIGFLINLLGAIKGGFGLFFGNIGTHLLGGVSGWLFGEVRKAGLTPPAELSLGEVFRFILDVLGIGLEFFIARVEKINPAAGSMLRTGAAIIGEGLEWLTDLVNEGPASLWRHMQEQLTNLWETAIGAVVGWVSAEVTKKMIPRILAMFDPTGIGAVVNSLVTFYNAIQAAVEYLQPMLEIVHSVVDGISQIAQGALEGGAAFVEGALSRSVPIALGFLAHQVGLGALGKRISETVEALREKIANAVDNLLERGKAFLMRIGSAIGKWYSGLTKKVDSDDGGHTLLFREEGGKPALKIRSVEQSVNEFLKAAASNETIKKDTARLQTIQGAKDLVAKINKSALACDKAGNNKKADLQNEISADQEELAKMIQKILKGIKIEKFDERYKLEGITGSYGALAGLQTGDKMTPDHQPQAAVLKYAANLPAFKWREKGKKAEVRALRDATGGKHANGAFAINLHEARHKEGRTYGHKSKDEKVLPAAKTAIDAAKDKYPNDYEKQRRAVVGIFQEELKKDFDAMHEVLEQSQDGKAWEDLKKLVAKEALSQEQADAQRKKITIQVQNGLKKMKAQDLNKYAE